MMGRKNKSQKQFFYAFDLEDYIPPDHLLRGIDRFLDLNGLHAHLSPYYSHTGRPLVDPELLIRMMIIGYCYGIRSMRQVCEEVNLNLAYRWFCGLSIEDKVSDPGSSWTAAPGVPAFYGYSTNYLVDTGNGVIVDVESTTANMGKEVESTRVMLDRVERRFDLRPGRLIGDTAYGTASMLGWLVEEKGIEPHIPVWEKGERKDGTFSRSDFTFDAATDQYTCPNGKPMVRYQRTFTKPRSGVHKDQMIRYHARTQDCGACAFKEQCCPNTPRRKVNRSVHESARDVARTVVRTEDYRRSRRQRKQVEMLFARMKRILKVDRLRLRGLSGANDEFLLTATAQNLRRMVKLLGTGPPGQPEIVPG